MKTFKEWWEDQFIHKNLIGIDQDGIDKNYAEYNEDEIENIIASGISKSIERNFRQFCLWMKPGDFVIVGMGQTTKFNISGIAVVTADIEQPLTGGNLIKSTDFFPKQTKDFDLYLVEAFNQVVDLTLHGHANAMNPFEQLEDPTQGRPLRRLVDLVWYRLVLTRSWLAQATLRHRIDQQG